MVDTAYAGPIFVWRSQSFRELKSLQRNVQMLLSSLVCDDQLGQNFPRLVGVHYRCKYHASHIKNSFCMPNGIN